MGYYIFDIEYTEVDGAREIARNIRKALGRRYAFTPDKLLAFINDKFPEYTAKAFDWCVCVYIDSKLAVIFHIAD